MNQSLQVDSLAVLVSHIKCHPVLHTLHQMAAFGIERDYQIVFLGLCDTGFGSLVHAAAVVVTGLIGLAVDGEHTRVEPVPNAEIVGCHLPVIKGPRVVAAITMMAHVEVQHPTGIGTQLIIA